MILYSGPLSMFGAKAEIAILEKAIPCTREMVPFSLAHRYSPTHPEVARINPKKQVPVLIDGSVEIYDSTQIFEYLEDRAPAPRLWPADAPAKARARRLELETDEVFFPHAVQLMRPGRTREEPEVQNAMAGAGSFYARMEALLADDDYLAGSFSYADIAFYMAQFFAAFLGAEMAEEHARLNRWRRRMLERAPVRTVVGPICAFLAENGLRVPETEGRQVL